MGYNAIAIPPKIWTYDLTYTCSAAANTTDYFGPGQSGGTTTYPAQQLLNTNWGTGPVWFPYLMLPHAPVDSLLVTLSFWIRFNSTSLVEDVSLFKVPYVDLATTGTPVAIATVNLDSTGLTALTTVYDYTINVAAGNQFNAGDAFCLLRKNVSGAAPYFVRAAARFRELT